MRGHTKKCCKIIKVLFDRRDEFLDDVAKWALAGTTVESFEAHLKLFKWR